MSLVVVTSQEDLRALISEQVEKTVSALLADHASEADEWLTDREARAYLGRSKATMYRYRRDGVLPFSKMQGRIYYRRGDLDDVLERHRVS